MRVLERKTWSYSFTCASCGSKLLAEPDDVKYGVSGMDAEGGYYCECIVCKRQHDITRVATPDNIRDKAYEEFRKRNP